MKFFETQSVLLVLAILADVYCTDDSDGVSVEVEENDQDFDEFFPMECGEHEEYNECTGDPECQKTCENMDQWETMACARTRICIRGCICEDGYVRDNYNGVCMEENSCPRVKH
nr:PREDICTED: venom peptide SjAPI-like [Linepithema humile]